MADSSRGGGRGGRGGKDKSWRGGRGGGGSPHGSGGYQAGSSGGGQAGSSQSQVDVYLPPEGRVTPPDASITLIEDNFIKNSKTKGSKLPEIASVSLNPRLPVRPAFGDKGTPVTLTCNYFDLKVVAQIVTFRYHVDINPDVQGKKRMRVMELLLNGPLASFKPGLASDFGATVLATQQLGDEEALQFDVPYLREEETEAAQNAQVYRVVMSETGTFRFAELLDYVTSTNISAAFDNEADVTQQLNIVMGYQPKASPEIMSIGANKHFDISGTSEKDVDLPGALRISRGSTMSVRASSGRIILNVQVKSAATYQAGRLDDLIKQVEDHSRSSGIVARERFVKRLRVKPLHLKSQNRPVGVKTIFSLASTNDGPNLQHPPRVARLGAGPKQVEFFVDEAPTTIQRKGAVVKAQSYISVFEFFSKVHNIQVRDDMSVVNVGNRERPSYLPADCCQVVPGQPCKTKLSPDQTAHMIKFAVRKPSANARYIATSSRKTLGLTEQNETLRAFGLSVDKNLITIPARILQPPQIKYANSNNIRPRFGGWQIPKNAKLGKSMTLEKWGVIWIRSRNLRDPWNFEGLNLKNSAIDPFVTQMNRLGITTREPGLITVDIDNRDIGVAIDQGFIDFGKRDFRYALVILPSKDETIYSHVKYCGDVKFGVRTACVVANTFSMKNDTTFTNIALKINQQLGGKNHEVDSQLGVIAGGKTMVVGIDVTHPSPGSSENAPSIAAMVASISKDLSQFPVDIRVQEARKEMVTEFGDMFKSRLTLWRKFNQQALPENIIVCRDGVSEGQYLTVVDEELAQLQKACREVYPKNKQPAITFIVVGKRHNTRFYPTSTQAQGGVEVIDTRSKNTPNGTVVDRSVTQARHWDFFLQSHMAVQGTARPAHYFVVHDDIIRKQANTAGGSAATSLENMLHSMCYTFGRAPKAVSICPPAYYADLACERARVYMRHLFSPDVTPAGSQADSSSQQGSSGQAGSSGKAPAFGGRSAKVHERIKDTMFYI